MNWQVFRVLQYCAYALYAPPARCQGYTSSCILTRAKYYCMVELAWYLHIYVAPLIMKIVRLFYHRLIKRVT